MLDEPDILRAIGWGCIVVSVFGFALLGLGAWAWWSTRAPSSPTAR